MAADEVSAEEQAERDQFRAERDLRTLVDSQKIQEDKKRMGNVRAEAKRQREALDGVDK